MSDITGGEVAAALRAGDLVTTSRPSPEVFAECYRSAAGRGVEAVVSVHLSRGISGTYDAAVAAAAKAPIPVRVVDSGTVAMALGFAALAGAELAAQGATAAAVTELIERRAAASAAFFCVDSLEYLRRGGRIGAAQALLGSALSVKPLLRLSDGLIQPYERVRTRAKALARLQALACEVAISASLSAVVGDSDRDLGVREEAGAGHGSRRDTADEVSIDLAVHHLDDEAGAADLAMAVQSQLRAARVPLGAIEVSQMSAVLGVHAGPGTLGIIVAPRVP